MTGTPPSPLEDEWTIVLRGLSATLKALPSRPTGASLAEAGRVRQLTITLAVDEDYRRRKGWEKRATDCVDGASRILEVEFGIGLAIAATQEWVSADQPRTLGHHLSSMLRQVSVGSGDIIVGLTGQAPLEPDSSGTVPYGVSEAFGRSVLVRQSETVTDLPAVVEVIESVVIAREVAHLFGALRADGPTGGDLLGFDDRTRHIVALTRNRSFDEGEPLDVNADSLMAIYRTAGSAGAAMLSILEEKRAGGD